MSSKGCERNGNGVFDILWRHLWAASEGNHEKTQWGWSVPLPIFKPSATRIRVYSITSPEAHHAYINSNNTYVTVYITQRSRERCLQQLPQICIWSNWLPGLTNSIKLCKLQYSFGRTRQSKSNSRKLISFTQQYLFLTCYQSQSYFTTDGQPASLSWNKAPIWGLRPDLYYLCDSYGLVLVGRPLWREVGSVLCLCCWPCQRSRSRVGVPWDLRPYFTVSDLRLPFFVASYDSQGHGGGIRPRLHTGKHAITWF
jgi:hypothetical protein